MRCECVSVLFVLACPSVYALLRCDLDRRQVHGCLLSFYIFEVNMLMTARPPRHTPSPAQAVHL